MRSICFILRMHQPYRLRRVGVFETAPAYFDDQRTRQQCKALARRGYVPVCKLLLELARRLRGRFRLCCSISGVLLEQLSQWDPQVIQLFHELSETGCVEWLGQTYYHSPSGLYSPAEFRAQIEAHRERVSALFDQDPVVYWDADGVLDPNMIPVLRACGFQGAIGGTTTPLPAVPPSTVSPSTVSPSAVSPSAERSETPETPQPDPTWPTLLAARNMRDLLEVAFDAHGWRVEPKIFQTVTEQLDRLADRMPAVDSPHCLYLDCGMFSEPKWLEAGLLTFFAKWPGQMLARGNAFPTASEWLARFPHRPEQVEQRPSGFPGRSSSRTEAEATATGNLLQRNVLSELYGLESAVLATQDRSLIRQWRQLQSVDHVLAMEIKDLPRARAVVGQGISATRRIVTNPTEDWDTPYDAYIAVKNILGDLRRRTDIP